MKGIKRCALLEAEMEALRADLLASRASEARLVEGLREFEWAYQDGHAYKTCPVCDRQEGTEPHTITCWLAALLSAPSATTWLAEQKRESFEDGRLQGIEEAIAALSRGHYDYTWTPGQKDVFFAVIRHDLSPRRGLPTWLEAREREAGKVVLDSVRSDIELLARLAVDLGVNPDSVEGSLGEAILRAVEDRKRAAVRAVLVKLRAHCEQKSRDFSGDPEEYAFDGLVYKLDDDIADLSAPASEEGKESATKPCTCSSHQFVDCRGVEGLGKGWHCVMTGQRGNPRSRGDDEEPHEPDFTGPIEGSTEHIDEL